ncbi:MAG: MinD/ParA family ATP-binding protein [Betaproteobacteria bacterium]
MPAPERAGPGPVADQADGLRRLIAHRAPGMLALSGADPRDYARLALDLAVLGDRAGRRVLLLDLTRGALASEMACTAPGCAPRYELMHVIDAHKRIEEIVAVGPRGIPLLPAARGLRALASAWRGRQRFAAFVESAGGAPKLVLAVTPATELPVLAQLAAFASLVVVGPQGATNLKACYAALKRAHAVCSAPPRLVYGEALDAEAARLAHLRLAETARAFLGGEPELLGRLGAARDRDRQPVVRRAQMPQLSIDQLWFALAGWPLPRMGAGAAFPAVARRGSRIESCLH